MQKLVTLFDAQGNLIQYGGKLGTGGEGDVFELGLDLVAKVYHQPLSPTKQKKLVAMANAQTPELLKIATWPIKTLHSSRYGPVCGLVMPRLTGYKEIHKLYGPAHRKNEFPSADWAFLIQVARNTAAAVATMHRLGYVIGDINPGNIAISSDALAKLIDCDSFQVNLNGQLYPCEVGVAHFTPPELQGKSFSNVTRSPNHDNFGLALLCFHLLFMGRHPFAGKYKDGKEDMPIEKAIREFRFAYSVKATTQSMAPPPNTLLLNVVSPELAQMFELALGQNGVFGQRPTASQWVKELEGFKNNLLTCTRFPAHKFYRALSNCPWCALESKSRVTFFLPSVNIKRGPSVDLNRVWQDILNFTSPGSLSLPTFSFTPPPTPLPTFLMAPTVGIKDFSEEKNRRHTLLITAEADWRDIQKRWLQETGDAKFKAKRLELNNLHQNLIEIESRFKAEKQKFEAKAKEVQLKSYLEQHYVDQAKISGIGPTRKATLASYGIETAADIERNAILAIPGFGDTLTYELMQWRKSVESKFIYNPRQTVTLPELLKLSNEHEAKRVVLESALLKGFEELKQIKETLELNRLRLAKEAQSSASKYAQAEADWSLLQNQLEQLRKQRFKKLRKSIIGFAIASITVVVLLSIFAINFIESPIGRTLSNTLITAEKTHTPIATERPLSPTAAVATEQAPTPQLIAFSTPALTLLDYATLEHAYEQMREEAWQQYKTAMVGSPVAWRGTVLKRTQSGDAVRIDVGQKHHNDVILMNSGIDSTFSQVKIGDAVEFTATIESISTDLEIKLANVEFVTIKSNKAIKTVVAK